MTTTEPRVFKRGPDFEMILALPSYIPAGQFTNYVGKAQIRAYKDDTPEGFIAEITFEWTDEEDARLFTLKNSDTENWPLGLAELDVLLTSPDGHEVGTKTILLRIARSVTRSV